MSIGTHCTYILKGGIDLKRNIYQYQVTLGSTSKGSTTSCQLLQSSISYIIVSYMIYA